LKTNILKASGATKKQRVLALGLIIIGVAGIILPVLPGWPFIFWGLFILGGVSLIESVIIRFVPRKYKQKIHDFIEKTLGDKKR